jgi:hypothetical protein
MFAFSTPPHGLSAGDAGGAISEMVRICFFGGLDTTGSPAESSKQQLSLFNTEDGKFRVEIVMESLSEPPPISAAMFPSTTSTNAITSSTSMNENTVFIGAATVALFVPNIKGITAPPSSAPAVVVPAAPTATSRRGSAVKSHAAVSKENAGVSTEKDNSISYFQSPVAVLIFGGQRSVDSSSINNRTSNNTIATTATTTNTAVAVVANDHNKYSTTTTKASKYLVLNDKSSVVIDLERAILTAANQKQHQTLETVSSSNEENDRREGKARKSMRSDFRMATTTLAMFL